MNTLLHAVRELAQKWQEFAARYTRPWPDISSTEFARGQQAKECADELTRLADRAEAESQREGRAKICLGPLLDAWDALGNDEKPDSLRPHFVNLQRSIGEIGGGTLSEEAEGIVDCLGDGAARLRHRNPDCWMADSMERAAALIEELSDASSHPQREGQQGQDDKPISELDCELAIKWRDDMRELQEHCRSMSERRRGVRRIMDAKVVAFGCKEEARGGRCCSEWCLGDDCPVTFAEPPPEPRT